jgi:CRISPR-associated endonuclease/helicase Cas3
VPAPTRTKNIQPAKGTIPPHEDCWAKTTKEGEPGISVRDHCLNVGCVAEALVALLPPQIRELAPPGAATLAALHDVGKVSPGFQVKCIPWLMRHSLVDRATREGWSTREPPYHAKVSQFTVQELLQNQRLHPWAAAVGAHHGRIEGERVRVHEPWQEERVRLARELIREFGGLPDQAPGEAALWFLAGLISVADWIGSDESHFPQDACWQLPERRRRGQVALATIGWRPVKTRRLDGLADLFPENPHANPLQTASLDVVCEPGVYVIEGPMGYGKTEAALAAAYQLISQGSAAGLYFALPSQVTSNRIHLRVRSFVNRISVEPEGVRLAHSASWLSETGAGPSLYPASKKDAEANEHVRAGRSWFASAKRALLAPFGVGTIDQSLLGIVAAKHFFVRQFGLAGKVVVLDEVHTYDLYTSTLIEKLVERLRELQCSVIVLSATLTERRRRRLLGLTEGHRVRTPYPVVSGMVASLVERECAPGPSKTIQVRNMSGAIPVEEAIDRARGECVLWIRNTVDEAQQTYRALQSANFQGGPSIALLHSRFPFFRRDQLEAEWMDRLGKDAARRPVGCLLVSTQVAEQSVDIDADLLITDLAPTDMLLQRLGRLWRHERPGRRCLQPEVWILSPRLSEAQLAGATKAELREALGKSARVYAPYVLLRSLDEWRRQRITLPDEIRPILEATYADPADNEPPAWRELRDDLERTKQMMARQALTAAAVWHNPSLPDEEGVQTRYSTYPMAELLLLTEITPLSPHSARLTLLNGDVVTAHERNWSFETTKAIYRNLARVPYWALRAGLATPPRWLASHVWQQTAVGLLRRDGNIRWPGDDQETGLSYQADQGVVIDRTRVPRAPEEEFDEPYD